MRNPRKRWMSMAALATAGLTLVVFLPNAASAVTTAPRCNGRVATIVSAAATITGTAGNDVIMATGSAGQTIRSGRGNDVICGSAGPDRIFADDGNDTVLSGNGDDVVDAGIGNDTVDAGVGRDIVIGGAGDDQVTGGGGDDLVSGNLGNDTLNGGLGNDRVNGDDGNDLLSGNEGNDTLNGGLGNDRLSGGPAPDVIDPGAGSNLCGSDSSDSMRGPCALDTTGPVISNIVVPRVVTAGGTMTFTWRVTDTGGVSNTNMRFGGYSGWITSWCGFVTVADLVAGDAFTGTYRAVCNVPSTAVNGTYTLFLMASDTFGNGSAWDSSSQVDFTVAGGSADASPPAVSQLQARVDGGSVVVSWQASDPAGVAGQSAWLAHNVYSFASVEGPYFAYNAAVLVSGDALNGVYEQRIDRRQIAPNGTYTVWLTVIDTLGNKSFDRTATTFVL